MFSLLKQLIDVFETVDIVPIQISKHLLTDKSSSLKHFVLNIHSQVYPQESQMTLILPFD